MTSSLATSFRARRWLLVASIAAAGTLGGALVDRSPPHPASAHAPTEAVRAAHRVAPHPERAPRVVIAYLVAGAPVTIDVGNLAVEEQVTFAADTADNATLNVLVRYPARLLPSGARSASEALGLQLGARYRLVLTGPVTDARADAEPVWRADRIDQLDPSAEPAEPTRPAIADRMCVDVHPPGCERR